MSNQTSRNRPELRVFCRGTYAPLCATPGSVAFDLTAGNAAEIGSGHRTLILTGIHVAIPPGYEGQIRPRSGLALKYGVTVLNAPGTIDSDYRGEIGVILINHGADRFDVMLGDRIAQLVITPVMPPQELTLHFVTELEDLGATKRGTGGFGSTGL